MPFVVGETVGPYQILEQLGQGGMATVFKAYHPALDRYVAIKALHPAFTIEPNFLTRFQREAQVVARLEHPNIVPVYDFAEYEGRPYLVLKFIEGDTLKARLNRGPLELSEITEIVESVGAALDYAHHRGVLHRDVKPSNVLLADDGRIYLADFGLARIAQAGESTISSDVMLGTPQYISPEQAMGQRDLDDGTDIYSFGVLLYEMLVGRVPYSADTPYSIIHDHIYAPLPLPRTVKEDIPEPIERLLLKALAKDRADRFSDVAAMMTAWKATVEGIAGTRQVSPVGVSEDTGAVVPPAVSAQPALVESESLGGESRVQSQPLSSPLQGDSAIGADVKRRPRWLWLGFAGLLVACCLCIVGAFAISPRLRQQFRQLVASDATPVQTQSAVLVETPPRPPVHTPGEAPGVPPGQQVPPPPPPHSISIEDAQRRVEAEPDNPNAYLDLAIAYWDEKMYEDAESAFSAALERAGDDPEFFIRAGDATFERGLWLETARLYLDAMRIMKEPVLPELQERTRQALYLAAGDPEAEELLSSLPASRIPPDFIAILQARHTLYQGQIMRAKALERRVNERKSDLPELKLLEAEILIAEGENDQAKAKLKGLLSDPVAPQWVRQVADYVLNEAIPGE